MLNKKVGGAAGLRKKALYEQLLLIMIKHGKTNYPLNIYSARKSLLNVVMLFWLFSTFFSQTFLKQAVIAEAHTCVFIQELMSWQYVFINEKQVFSFCSSPFGLLSTDNAFKNLENACQFYIRTGITSHIFSFIAKDILFLESFYWTLLPLMSIWISPAVQSAFLGNAL